MGRKIISSVVVYLLIVTIIISGVFHSKSQNSKAVLDEYNTKLNDYFNNKIELLDDAAENINAGNLSEYSGLVEYLDSMVLEDHDILSAYACDNNNEIVMDGGFTIVDDIDFTTRQWYTEAQNNPDAVYISDPYIDYDYARICITISKATYKDGQIFGVVGMDIDIDKIIYCYSGDRFPEEYQVLATADGVIIAHPDFDYAYSNDNKRILSKSGYGKVQNLPGKLQVITDYSYKTKFAISKINENTGWYVIYVSPASVLNKLLLGSIVSFISLLSILSYLIIKNRKKPIDFELEK